MDNQNKEKDNGLEEQGTKTPQNRGFALVAISLFMIILIIPTVAWGIANIVWSINPEVKEVLAPQTDELAPEAFPDKFDPKTYTADIEAWYNDALPFRALIMNTYKGMESELEKPYLEGIRPSLIELFHKGQTMENPEPEDEEITFEDPFDDIFEDDTDDESVSEEQSVPEYPTEEQTVPEYPTEDGTVGEDVTETAEPCEHEMTWEIEKDPTCIEYGVRLNSCTKCDYYYREYVAMIPHSYNAEYESGEMPLCGYSYNINYSCKMCSDTYSKSFVKKHDDSTVFYTVDPSYEDYGYTLVFCADCGGTYRKDIKNKPIDNSYFVPITLKAGTFEGRYKWTFITANNYVAYFEGTNLPDLTELDEYTTVFARLNELCKENGKKLQIAIWPNKAQVYPEYVGITPQTSYKRMDMLVDYITTNSDVNIIYPINELKAMKPYIEVYHPNDSHWNNAGGFIGMMAMFKGLGLDTESMFNLPVIEVTPNSQSYSEYITNDLERIYYTPRSAQISGDISAYPIPRNYVIKYLWNVNVLTREGKHGYLDVRHTTSDGPNDLNFVLLGDSFRVMQFPYFERAFTDCYLGHRYSSWQGHANYDPSVTEAVLNADILCITAVERLEGELLRTARELIAILEAGSN